MGYGTAFTTEIYLSRQLFENRYQLDETVKELEGYIESSKKELTALAMSTPKDIISEKDESGYPQNPFDVVLRRTSEIFEFMEENYRDLNKLYQYQNYLDENPNVDMGQFKDI